MTELDLGRVVGQDGQGVPTGGTAGQVLKKRSATDYDAEWGNEDLGLTGAAVGDLVRVNAVDENGKPTSWKHVPLNEIKTNRNLLDNWYFVGGGSQLREGVFPINQRGQTSYSATGYGIDRWYNVSSLIPVTMSEGYITSHSIFQRIEGQDKLLGLQLTFSALFEDGTLLSGTKKITTFSAQTTFASKAVPGGALALLYNSYWRGFQIDNSASGATFNLIAAKLELGTEQTLAHKENGVWVLNEIPDYAVELLKCQQYYLPLIAGVRVVGTYVGNGTFRLAIPTPIKMKGTISANLSALFISSHLGLSTATVSSVVSVTVASNSVLIDVATDYSGSLGVWVLVGISLNAAGSLSSDL